MRAKGDQRDFAREFLKYEDDGNNFALYLWGYVDLMIDYHKHKKINPGPLSSDQVRVDGKWDRKSGVLNIYGESGVYPQFGGEILQSEIYFDEHRSLYVIPESGEIKNDWRVFKTRIGGTYTSGNTCETFNMKAE